MRLVLKSTGLCHQRLMDMLLSLNSTTEVGNNKILSTTEHEVIINGLTLSTYNISVYSYKDLPSINSTQTLLRFNGKFISG